MESNGLDDKDVGPEVQISFPESVTSRIEELMGGTEQFDSEEFDAVSYINRVFPTEQSLAGVDSAAARCEMRLAGVEADIRRLVRDQAQQRQDGHEALLQAQQCIADLALQVTDINKKAGRSESMVREITAEIKQLDRAKSNLTAAITALNHYHMLCGAATSLRAMASQRQYSALLPPLQAVMQVLEHFSRYRDIRSLSALRDDVTALRHALAAQILADFKEAFTAGKASTVSAKTLSEACGVVDALEPKVKRELLTWFTTMQLQEYEHLFSAEQECARLAHVERRYAWLKRHLLAFEDGAGHVFPASWRLSERIAAHFCEVTKTQLTALLAARRSELDVKLLLYAIQKTYAFELLLHKRFQDDGATLPDSAELNVDPQAVFDADAKDPGTMGGAARPGGPWVGIIGSCFEPYLSIYISSLDSNLASLMDRFIQDAKTPAAPTAPAAEAGAVLSSCADLFLFYKKCLVQCAHLTTGEPMLELAGVFQKYLREYASAVLRAAVPRAAPAALTLVANLHGLATNQPASTQRYSAAEISRVTSVITTAEYCLETTVHLQQKLKEKVAPRLAARIDLTAEQELFHALIADCIAALVGELEAACEPALQAMARAAWLHVQTVGDGSAYVAQLVLQLAGAVPALRDQLAGSRKYFTQFCIRFANSFIPKFIQNIYKCKPISTAGAEQLLLDTHMLKTALLDLPSIGSEVKRPAPATYTKVVIKLMTKAEMILKLVMAPLEGAGGAAGGGEAFVAQFVQLLQDATLQDFHKVLDMKGGRLSKAQLSALDALFKQAARSEGN
ncbi:vacuolar protein sorting-associated protein 53 homolog [Cydia pomonella]|uniref:vacuolar protein sorting-associated protein 53 homolog n=1 Tax=Cydia pomonella TaxID=82600 RepID=UPI002ADD93EF|nr:vacuolar protein sorting-associated protein 53 homolog [Cydia pomonella]